VILIAGKLYNNLDPKVVISKQIKLVQDQNIEIINMIIIE